MSDSNEKDSVKPDHDQMDKDFINRLRHELYARDPRIFDLKNALGQRIDADIKAYISFKAIAGNTVTRFKEDVCFFISTLFYNSEYVKDEETPQNPVLYDELLGRLYEDSTSSTRRSISSMLSRNYDDSGAFTSIFIRLFRRAIKYRSSNETINYARLLHDLKFWDADLTVKKTWANRIVCRG